MADYRIETGRLDRSEEGAERGKGWFAVGGMVGAVFASACCIGPLVLLTLGVSGAWIGNLTALEPYKPYFAAIALVLIGLGFRKVFAKAKTDCDTGSFCSRSESSRMTKASLWVSTLLVASALTIDWWAPLFY